MSAIFGIRMHFSHLQILHVKPPHFGLLLSRLLKLVGDAVSLWIWKTIEASVKIICACLFASKPAVMLPVLGNLIVNLRS